MIDLARLRERLDGGVFAADTPGYEAVRRPANARFGDARPRLVVRCGSVADVALTLRYAADQGLHVVPRGGGHCFAGRSSTDGIVADLGGLDGIAVDDEGVATIGAGARLGEVYAALGEHGRTIPAGCGATVGIAGLTLGGGIGLLGREHGLTCDSLVGARVVLADGRIVDCGRDREPELFWALRGAGGGQFGVVASLAFATVPEPTAIRVEAHWSSPALEELVAAWQAWAPGVPDGLTANLAIDAEPYGPVRATLFGASTIEESPTRKLLRAFTDQAGAVPDSASGTSMPYRDLKRSFGGPDALEPTRRAVRSRSECFSGPMSERTIASLADRLGDPEARGPRRLVFTAMGGAYNRVAEDATAFAHRDSRFLLEHVADAADRWVDRSWATAHSDGSGRVYPNFPDSSLEDWAAAYHAGNRPRLTAAKRAYDPHRFFDFHQAI